MGAGKRLTEAVSADKKAVAAVLIGIVVLVAVAGYLATPRPRLDPAGNPILSCQSYSIYSGADHRDETVNAPQRTEKEAWVEFAGNEKYTWFITLLTYEQVTSGLPPGDGYLASGVSPVYVGTLTAGNGTMYADWAGSVYFVTRGAANGTSILIPTGGTPHGSLPGIHVGSHITGLWYTVYRYSDYGPGHAIIECAP